MVPQGTTSHQLLFTRTDNTRLVHSADINHCTTSILTLLVLNFFWENFKMYLRFLSFPNTDMTQTGEMFPLGRQRPGCPTESIPWLLMSWRRKEPGHQQPWYWLNSPGFNTRRVKLLICHTDQGWGLQRQFPLFLIIIFTEYWNTMTQLIYITFIFNRCYRSLVQVMAIKQEFDLMNPKYNFTT